MKPTLLLGCSLLAGTVLHAQFTFLPYAGYEQSRTNLNTSVLSAQDINGFLKAGLRTAYQLKGGHGPFVNFTTAPAPVSFAFDNAGSLVNQFRTSNLQWRLEAGYLYSSKPIRLGKGRSPQRATGQTVAPAQKKSCGYAMVRSSCGSRKAAALSAQANPAMYLRLQPSLAFAYLPSSTQSVARNAGGFEYTPSWKTAVVPAMNVEFAKGAQRLFTVGVFYTAPLGQRDEAVTTAIQSKNITTALQPQLATWGITLGVPFSLAKTRTVTKTPVYRIQQSKKKSCTRSYYRRSLHM